MAQPDIASKFMAEYVEAIRREQELRQEYLNDYRIDGSAWKQAVVDRCNAWDAYDLCVKGMRSLTDRE